MTKPPKNLKFEQALEKLQALVGKLEDGELSLDDSLKVFEEGIDLAKLCEKKLEEAEGKVEMLLKAEENSGEPHDI